jgi:hypothetical protein
VRWKKIAVKHLIFNIMSIIIRACIEDGTIPDYICNPCEAGENGRVRGAAYIDKSLKAAITEANIASETWWAQHIESGKIKIIPNTRGTFDGGTKKTVTGFGDDKEKIIGKTFAAVVNDINHTGNEGFYEALENNYKDYIFAFRTKNELRVATDVMTGLEVKDAVEEDTDTTVVWQANITWDQNAPKMLVPVYLLTDAVKKLFTACVEIDE